MMIVKIVCCFILGLIIGFAVQKNLQLRKGPSSTSVQQITYSKDHKFVPVIHVCPPSINPNDYEHSDD